MTSTCAFCMQALAASPRSSQVASLPRLLKKLDSKVAQSYGNQPSAHDKPVQAEQDSEVAALIDQLSEVRIVDLAGSAAVSVWHIDVLLSL